MGTSRFPYPRFSVSIVRDTDPLITRSSGKGKGPGSFTDRKESTIWESRFVL